MITLKHQKYFCRKVGIWDEIINVRCSNGFVSITITSVTMTLRLNSDNNLIKMCFSPWLVNNPSDLKKEKKTVI